MGDELKGMVLGIIGVAIFSLTLPATRVAVSVLDPVTVGLGRAVVAAIVAVAILLGTRQSLPPRRTWGRLLTVAFGIVLGFPLFMTLAASWLLLGEVITPQTLVFAVLVVGAVAWGRRMAVRRPELPK